MKKLKEFKKLYDEMQMLNKYVPGWQLMSAKSIKVMYGVKLKQAGQAVTKKRI